MEGGTESYGNFLLSMLDTFVRDMADQEFKGDEYLAKSNRYRRSSTMDRAIKDKAAKDLKQKGQNKKYLKKVQAVKITSASVEEIAFQVLSHSLLVIPLSYSRNFFSRNFLSYFFSCSRNLVIFPSRNLVISVQPAGVG